MLWTSVWVGRHYRLNQRVGASLNYRVGNTKITVKTDFGNGVGFSVLFPFKTMSSQFVERIHDPIAETLKVGIPVRQAQYFLDQRISSFNRPVRYPFSLYQWERRNDFFLPVIKSDREIISNGYIIGSSAPLTLRVRPPAPVAECISVYRQTRAPPMARSSGKYRN